jgi:GTP-dependent dephospho-CoA kinase
MNSALTSFRPSQSDIARLKTPLGKLLTGSPSETMPKLRTLIRQSKPSKVTTVGDIVSRETLTSGIQVNLRIVDQMTLRQSITPIEVKAKRTYRVRNPAGTITKEAWGAIKEALHHREALIIVDGEEDLLAIPAILESPDNAFIVYGQPSQGLVVVTASPVTKQEVREIMNRMTEE